MMLQERSQNLPQDLKNSSTASKTATETSIGASHRPKKNKLQPAVMQHRWSPVCSQFVEQSQPCMQIL